MGAPLILRLKNRIEDEHNLLSSNLNTNNDGTEVSAELTDDVSKYNIFFVAISKTTEGKEETTVAVLNKDVYNYFRLFSGNKDYYVEVAVKIGTDNKIYMQTRDISGWQWRDNIAITKVVGI